MPANLIRTTCGYCSTGCRLTVDPESKKVWPDADYPVNRGAACPKGFLLLEPLKAADRATRPCIKSPEGRLVPTDWDTAVRAFADNFKPIQARSGKYAAVYLRPAWRGLNFSTGTVRSGSDGTYATRRAGARRGCFRLRGA